jgi:hypothetical protein
LPAGQQKAQHLGAETTHACKSLQARHNMAHVASCRCSALHIIRSAIHCRSEPGMTQQLVSRGAACRTIQPQAPPAATPVSNRTINQGKLPVTCARKSPVLTAGWMVDSHSYGSTHPLNRTMHHLASDPHCCAAVQQDRQLLMTQISSATVQAPGLCLIELLHSRVASIVSISLTSSFPDSLTWLQSSGHIR